MWASRFSSASGSWWPSPVDFCATYNRLHRAQMGWEDIGRLDGSFPVRLSQVPETGLAVDLADRAKFEPAFRRILEDGWLYEGVKTVYRVGNPACEAVVPPVSSRL